MNKPDKSYAVYIVKRNDGQNIRLALLSDVLKYYYTGNDEDRIEIELKDMKIEEGEEQYPELWDKGSMIWFSPLQPRIWEATCLDERSKKENMIAKGLIDTLPDVDPMKKAGTLLVLSYGKDEFKVVDGQMREFLMRLN